MERQVSILINGLGRGGGKPVGGGKLLEMKAEGWWEGAEEVVNVQLRYLEIGKEEGTNS